MRQPYKRWRNLGRGGDTCFVTTTVLDFVPVFAHDQFADLAVRILFESCTQVCAALDAFVVMPHHVHFLLRLPPSINVSRFVQRYKSLSAREIRPLLPQSVAQQFKAQAGLNQRTFWQRSFRSVTIDGERFFRQKMTYIHENPVRAGLVESSLDWKWSSARLFDQGSWSEASGLCYDDWARQ